MDREQLADRLGRLRRLPCLRRDAPSHAAEESAANERASEARQSLARRDERRRERASTKPERESAEPFAGANVEAATFDQASGIDVAASRPRVSEGLPPDLERFERGASSLLARRTTYERAHRHGARDLAAIAHADARAFSLMTRDPLLADIDLSRALYLDTETSGLAGGVGTYVFLVGLGSFTEDGFEVWQGFLDDPSREASLLEEAAARVSAAPAIVSFFGKSFDRHRLEDRMRCLGIKPPFAGKAHLDLYHPLRRLYRRAFADHRLRTLESALCGVEREDDLPGAFAPAAWFDFIAGRPHRLEGVFRHNRDDVLSLVTLAAHLGAALQRDADPTAAEHELRAARAAETMRALVRAGDARAALRIADEVLAHHELANERVRELRVLRTLIACRVEEPALSAPVLRELCGADEDHHTAGLLLVLARLEERALADPRAALATAHRGAQVSARRHTGRELARFERAFESVRKRAERRLAALARKLA
jgi:uncharacterized protein YprB with RNaseH-like and TPR domain